MDILVSVINQKLRLPVNLKRMVEGTQNFVKFIFELDKKWDTLTTFAQFQQNGLAYNQYLDQDNSVYLPPEIRKGKCALILYGTKNDVIATTNYLELFIDENLLIKDANSVEITKSLYAQLVDKVNNFMTWDRESILDAKNAIILTEQAAKNANPRPLYESFDILDNSKKLTL